MVHEAPVLRLSWYDDIKSKSRGSGPARRCTFGNRSKCTHKSFPAGGMIHALLTVAYQYCFSFVE